MKERRRDEALGSPRILGSWVLQRPTDLVTELRLTTRVEERMRFNIKSHYLPFHFHYPYTVTTLPLFYFYFSHISLEHCPSLLISSTVFHTLHPLRIRPARMNGSQIGSGTRMETFWGTLALVAQFCDVFDFALFGVIQGNERRKGR